MNFLARILPLWMQPYAGRIFLTVLGLLIGISFLTLGFWRTMLIVLLAAAGYLLGKWEDGALDMSRMPRPRRWR